MIFATEVALIAITPITNHSQSILVKLTSLMSL